MKTAAHMNTVVLLRLVLRFEDSVTLNGSVHRLKSKIWLFLTVTFYLTFLDSVTF